MQSESDGQCYFGIYKVLQKVVTHKCFLMKHSIMFESKEMFAISSFFDMTFTSTEIVGAIAFTSICNSSKVAAHSTYLWYTSVDEEIRSNLYFTQVHTSVVRTLNTG